MEGSQSKAPLLVPAQGLLETPAPRILYLGFGPWRPMLASPFFPIDCLGHAYLNNKSVAVHRTANLTQASLHAVQYSLGGT